MATPDTRRSKSPAKSGALSPYRPNPGSPGKGSPKAKGAHMGTIKSLGLIHDLQEYISNVEAVTVEQKHELERLKEEKKEMEKTVLHMEVQGDRGMGGPLNEFFRASELTELPPKLRAVFEENKIMKEKLRKYKSRVQLLEQQASTRNNQLVALEDCNGLLRQQLEACSRTPAEVEREEALKGELYVKDRQIANLEHAVSVLKGKLETDAKLHRQALQAARKEQDGLKKQIVLAHAQLEEQDKELRAARLEIRRLNKSLAPSRGSPNKSLALGDEFMDGVSGPTYPARPAGMLQSAADQEPPQPSQQRPNSPPAVHLMLCLLRDDDDNSSKPARLPASSLAAMPFSNSAALPAMALLSPPPLQFGRSGRLSAPVTAYEQPPLSPLLHRPLDAESPLARLSAAFKSIKVISPPVPQPDVADLEPFTDTTQPLEEKSVAPVEALEGTGPEHEQAEQQGREDETLAQDQGGLQQAAEEPQGDGEAAADQAAESQEPQETHASAPRAVPYRHTAARPTGQKVQAEPKAPGKSTPQAGTNPRTSHTTLKPAAAKPGAQPNPPAAGHATQAAKRGAGSTAAGGRGGGVGAGRASRTGAKDTKPGNEKAADQEEGVTPRPWSSAPASGEPEQPGQQGSTETVQQEDQLPAAGDNPATAAAQEAPSAVLDPVVEAAEPVPSGSAPAAAPAESSAADAVPVAGAEQVSADEGAAAADEQEEQTTGAEQAATTDAVTTGASHDAVDTVSNSTPIEAEPAVEEMQEQPAGTDDAAPAPAPAADKQTVADGAAADSGAAPDEPSPAQENDAAAAVEEQPAEGATAQQEQQQADAVPEASTAEAGAANDVDDPVAAAAAEAAAKLIAESSGWPSLDEEQSEAPPKSEPTATTVGAETTATSHDGSSAEEAEA